MAPGVCLGGTSASIDAPDPFERPHTVSLRLRLATPREAGSSDVGVEFEDEHRARDAEHWHGGTETSGLEKQAEKRDAIAGRRRRDVVAGSSRFTTVSVSKSARARRHHHVHGGDDLFGRPGSTHCRCLLPYVAAGFCSSMPIVLRHGFDSPILVLLR